MARLFGVALFVAGWDSNGPVRIEVFRLSLFNANATQPRPSYTHTYIYIYIYVYVCIYICIHIYLYTYICSGSPEDFMLPLSNAIATQPCPPYTYTHRVKPHKKITHIFKVSCGY